ncbi:zinc ribbon domain-containing protein [Thermoflexus sp.]|uniref:zinc ribbon domain-containing protein n=1 Tax=Thermoflexus sp. TaxID=1969742 RepID=UPI002ADE2167|nr:zinc ribbon domain-containing protein [Thermoflexus sp.]
MKGILRGIRWGLVLVGIAALGVSFLTGGQNLGWVLLGILSLSLAVNLWLLPAALRRSIGGWFRFPRPSLPSPPSIPTATMAARLQEEIETTARGIARALEGTSPQVSPPAMAVFRCPSCGQRLDPHEVRCEGCGQPADFRCPYCSRAVDPTWRRCPACGGALPASGWGR